VCWEGGEVSGVVLGSGGGGGGGSRWSWSAKQSIKVQPRDLPIPSRTTRLFFRVSYRYNIEFSLVDRSWRRTVS
jgi:hypothetical protein